MKYDDPLAWDELIELTRWMEVQRAAELVKRGGFILQDRGAFERKAFRRFLFFEGKVDPNEPENYYRLFIHQGLRPLIPVGGIIMCLVRPEISLARDTPRENPGPIMNIDSLKILYEQFLRLYSELLAGEIRRTIPKYICLDMECSKEEAKEKLANAINQILYVRKVL